MRDYRVKIPASGTPVNMDPPPFNFIWNKTAATVTVETDAGRLELRQGEKVKLDSVSNSLRAAAVADTEVHLVVGSGWME